MQNMFGSNKIVVYTAIFGDYDRLLDPEKIEAGVDYVCFTDNRKIKSQIFKVVYRDRPASLDPNRAAKIFKIMPHLFLKKYDYSLWIDGNFLLKNYKLKDYLEKYVGKAGAKIAFLKHPDRGCAYEEEGACLALEKDDPNVMRSQMKRYMDEGYPRNNGLESGGIILRRNKDMDVIVFNETWWKEIQLGSKRDQLSLNYSLWKTGISYKEINQNIWDNDLGQFQYHGEEQLNHLGRLLESAMQKLNEIDNPKVRVPKKQREKRTALEVEYKNILDDLNRTDRMIDIIIPIYGDLEATRECLQSVLRYADDQQHLVFINDKSPDEDITKLLDSLANESNRVTLIEHENNLGFVKTVNEGMSLSNNRDVILLNSDTVVTKDWVKKLHARAYERDEIATVTPFSNSGGNFSFPNFLEKNPLPKFVTPEDMNFVFSLIPKTIIESPTGTGFCMYIKRDALIRLGLFDADTFGKGYGEESDFTLRAKQRGFINVALENTFIYHVDGASFGPEKEKIINENRGKLFEKNPDALKEVLEFEKADPLKVVRRKAKIVLFFLYPWFYIKYVIREIIL